MTIRHLRVFIAVAETERMSAAARRLYVAQPTVSQTVAEIEAHYGVRLFERLSKKLYITPEGARLLGYARHIVALFDEMEQSLQQASDRPSLKIGATMSVGGSILPELVSRYETGEGGFRAEVYVDNSREIETRLLRSRLDVALVEGRVKSAELLVRPVIRDELVLLCAPGHPFAGRASVKPEELIDQPFILREEGSGTRELFEIGLASVGISVERKWVCHTADAILRAVEAGQGLSVISRRLAAEAAAAGRVHMAAVEGLDLTRAFSLVYHKDKFLSPALLAFLEVCARGGEEWAGAQSSE